MSWWRRLLGRAELERQLDKELGFHLEAHVTELIAAGVPAAEARRRALLELGGRERVKEQCRDARGTRWVEDIGRDLRLAVRSLLHNRGFTVVALLTLTLGTGATAVMFSVLNGVLLKPLPFPEASRLVAIHSHAAGWNTAEWGEQRVALPDFRDLEAATPALESTAVLRNGATLSSPGEPEYLNTNLEVTAPFFSVLRVPLLLGRPFLPSEDRLGGAPVAILGYSLWQRHFDGAKDVLGRRFVLASRVFTVVGVTPDGFRYDDDEPDLLLPLGQDRSQFLVRRNATPLAVWARLKPGATLAKVQSSLNVVAARLARQYPDTNKGRALVVEPLRPDVGDIGATLWLLLGAVTLVLLIACTNVAGLLLARASARQREFAMRLALGAGRGRLIRQCLTESALLGLVGGALGVAFAAASLGPFVRLWPGSLPRATEIHLDWRVLLVITAVALVSGLLFGLAPALFAPTRRVAQSLRASSRSVTGSPKRLHRAFVIAELALAVVLLVAAGILGQTLLRVSSLNPGLNVARVLTARVALSPGTLAEPTRIQGAWNELLEHARRVPGVEAVAALDTVPLREGSNRISYWTSAEITKKEDLPMVLASSVTPEYLKVMQIPLRHGRFIDDHDRLGTTPVIVIDDVLAAHAFPHQDAIGKHLWIPDMPCRRPDANPFADCTAAFTVVGVVGHVRFWGLANDDQAAVRAQLYYPLGQVADNFMRRWSQLMSIAVRTKSAPLGILPALRQALRGAVGDQVIYSIHPLDSLAQDTLAFHRFLLLLFALFGGLALLLACIGVYGILAYSVSRRTSEVGVRMALGAHRKDVLRLIFRESLGMVVSGVLLGSVGALVAARLLAQWVTAVRSAEPVAFVLMIVLLVAAALLASFLPARRASHLDPVVALRQD
jgi:predicted permease